MKKMMVFVFALILSLTFVVAQDAEIEQINFKQVECQSLLQYKDKIIGQVIPSQIPFNTEIFNIYIAEESYGFLELNNSMIEEFDCIENENATYDILIESEATLFDIYESEALVDTLLEKISDGEIKIKGKSFTKKFKSTFVKIGLKIWSWFR